MTAQSRSMSTGCSSPIETYMPSDWCSGRINACKGDAHDPFLATIYVDTNGSAMSVGIAAPDRQQEAHSDCLVEVLSGLKYPTPGSWPAKVTVHL